MTIIERLQAKHDSLQQCYLDASARYHQAYANYNLHTKTLSTKLGQYGDSNLEGYLEERKKHGEILKTTILIKEEYKKAKNEFLKSKNMLSRLLYLDNKLKEIEGQLEELDKASLDLNSELKTKEARRRTVYKILLCRNITSQRRKNSIDSTAYVNEKEQLKKAITEITLNIAVNRNKYKSAKKIQQELMKEITMIGDSTEDYPTLQILE